LETGIAAYGAQKLVGCSTTVVHPLKTGKRHARPLLGRFLRRRVREQSPLQSPWQPSPGD